MTAQVVDGRSIANEILLDLRGRVHTLHRKSVTPCLVFVTIGASPPAQMYVHRLERLAEPVGVRVRTCMLDDAVSVNELEHQISVLSADETVDGVLVQMPLPESLLNARLSTLIYPRKDVDGITVHNAGRLYLGQSGQLPSTAAAMMHILDHCDVRISGSHAVVVGRSNVVGHPIAELLLHRDATVTVAHRKTRKLAELTRQANILVVAAGEPALIQPDMVSEGVVILDAGINVTPAGLRGDVQFEGCSAKASVITPVPGGIGPVTNAVLLRGVVRSAEHRHV
ncbi:MAG TPA: bifunctional 5,10-methylenetetrahydrofolate dehydrogenase/5,10-methenyltetrahydrofolate cyclohydrolase [Chloroflexota bacterium]